jgi:glutamate--cysteine ligase
VCATFVAGRAHELRELAPGTLYLPHATSLRMGRLGYLSEAQDSLAVSYNDLASYAASLDDALTKSYPAYEAVGIRDGDDYRQLATSLLQIENEFYSTIRPKRVVHPGERPLHALRERGVQYIEVRAMDLDPFSAIGITAETTRFLDVFLLHCLLTESPPDTPEEIAAVGRNKHRVAARGREPGLRLLKDGRQLELHEWAGQLLAECAPIAAALDAANGVSAHHAALSAAVHGLDEPASLPSARVLSEMQERYDGSFFHFALAYSLRHRSALQGDSLAADVEARHARLAEASLEKQRMIEAREQMPFESYRQQYLAPESLRAE